MLGRQNYSCSRQRFSSLPISSDPETPISPRFQRINRGRVGRIGPLAKGNIALSSHISCPCVHMYRRWVHRGFMCGPAYTDRNAPMHGHQPCPNSWFFQNAGCRFVYFSRLPKSFLLLKESNSRDLNCSPVQRDIQPNTKKGRNASLLSDILKHGHQTKRKILKDSISVRQSAKALTLQTPFLFAFTCCLKQRV